MMKVLSAEDKTTLYKDLLHQTVDMRKKSNSRIKRLLSDYIFKEIDNSRDKEKTTSQKKSGSHCLSELHHFQTYHKQ